MDTRFSVCEAEIVVLILWKVFLEEFLKVAGAEGIVYLANCQNFRNFH